MIWRLIALIGSGTFFFTGFSVLLDPNCVSASFSGSRAITITCYQNDLGDFSNVQAGLFSILIGLGILTFVFWRNISVVIKNYRYRQTSNRTNFGMISASNYGAVNPNSSISQNMQFDSGANTNEVNISGLKKCRYCAESIQLEAIKCRFCGSSQLPTLADKCRGMMLKVKPVLFKFEFWGWIVLLLIIAGLFLKAQNDRADAKIEVEGLKVNGRVCVSGDYGKTFEFGCNSYPIVSFEFCEANEFINPFWDEGIFGDFRDLSKADNGIIRGLRSERCSEGDFLYRIDSNLGGKVKGDYTLLYSAYSSNSRDSRWLEGEGGSFLIRVR